MGKNSAQPKDNMRVTVRFRNAAVADEFHRQAGEADIRPSPFAADLIERALTEGDAKNQEHETLRLELEELRGSVEALRGLPQELARKQTNNNDTPVELAALREEVAGLREMLAVTHNLSDDVGQLLAGLRELQANVAQLAALPHVFRKLREDVATGIHPLLVRSGHLSREEAEDWIRRNLLEE